MLVADTENYDNDSDAYDDDDHDHDAVHWRLHSHMK